MTQTMTPYAVLQVSELAPLSEIKKAYYRLAKRYHPDVNHAPDAVVKMKEINLAYEAIQSGRTWSFTPPIQPTPPPESLPVTMAEKIVYAKTHAVTDQFLIDLLVGGRDEYSRMTLEDLYEAVSSDVRAHAKRLCWQYRMQAVILRWYLRGLSIENAARKARLDDDLYNKGK